MPLLARAIAEYVDATRGLDRRVYSMSLGSFFSIAARMSVLTFLGVFLVSRGIDFTLVGAAFLVENVARAAIGPVSGAASDRFGRRRVLVVGWAASALLGPLFLLIRSPSDLFVWSVAIGLAQGLYVPSVYALIADLTPAPKQQTAFALNYTALSLGYLFGVAPAGFLAEKSYVGLAVLSFLCYVALGIVLLLGVRGPMPAPAARASATVFAASIRPLRDPKFLAFLAPAIVFPLGIGLLAAIPVYAAEASVSLSLVGAILASNGIVLALGSIPANARLAKRGPFALLGLSAVFLALTFALLAVSASPLVLLLALLAFNVGELVFSAALPTAVVMLAPRSERGAYQGAWSMAFSLGMGSALFLVGLAESAWGWRLAWSAFGALSLAVALVFVLERRGYERAGRARSDAADSRPDA